jgi:integral membrane sensor domain MASE1
VVPIFGELKPVASSPGFNQECNFRTVCGVVLVRYVFAMPRAAVPQARLRLGVDRPISDHLLYVVVVTSLAYGAGSLISYAFFHASSAGAVLFPPAGVSFAALVLTDKRRWVWVIAAVAITELLVDLSQGQGIHVVWGFVLANTIEPLVGAALFRRYFNEFDLGRLRDFLGFIALGIVAGPFVGALIGGTTISLGFHQGWIGAVLPFWAGDGLGVLTVGGVILTSRFPASLPRSARCVVLVVLGTVVTTVVGFWPVSVPLAFLPIPLLCFLAFRYGAAVVTIAGLSMALTANVMSAEGHGPWGVVGPTARLGISTLQLFVAIALIAAWLLAVEVTQHERTRSGSRNAHAARSKAESLQTVTARLAQAMTAEGICRIIVEDGIKLVATNGVAGVLNANGSELQTWTTADFPMPLAAKYHRVPMSANCQITAAIRSGTVQTAETRDDLKRWFPDTMDSYDATSTNSCMSVPARSGDQVVGALAFGFEGEGSIDAETIAFAQSLGDLAGQAIDRARRYEREYETAHRLQQALLPIIDSPLPGITAVARYRPADPHYEIGGDWYDVFALPDGRIGFAVGDVVGHDLDAAVAMSKLQSALRIIAATASSPASVLDQLEAHVSSIPGADITTVGYGDYDPSSRLLRYASAGHLPFLLHSDQGTTILWEGRSPPLGIASNKRTQGELSVPDAAVLVGFTDGLIERRGEPIDDGLHRLTELAYELHRNVDLTAWCESTIAQLVGDDARDDTALLCIRFDDHLV